MARFLNTDSEDETQFGQAQAKTQDPTPGYGAPLDAGGGGSAAQPQRQSQFQNISRLLYANQGQGQQLAQNAVNTVGAKAGAAQAQLNNATRAYQTQAQGVVPQSVIRPVTVQGPPTSSGTGGLTGAGRSGRTTTQVNTQPPPDEPTDWDQVQRIADSVYTGPKSLLQAQGVDQAGLSGAFTDAARAAGALKSQSGIAALLGHGGGVGALDSILAGREGRDALQAGISRFGNIRDMLNNAVKDTSISDAAAAETAKRAAEAQGAIKDRDAAIQAAETKKTNDANAAEAGRQADEALWEQFISGGPFAPGTAMSARLAQSGLGNQGITGFSSEDDMRRYFENNKDAIRRLLGK